MIENTHGGKRANAGAPRLEGQEYKVKLPKDKKEFLVNGYSEEKTMPKKIIAAIKDAEKKKKERQSIKSVTMQLFQGENKLINFYTDYKGDSSGGESLEEAFFCNKIEFIPYEGIFEIELKNEIHLFSYFDTQTIDDELELSKSDYHIERLNCETDRINSRYKLKLHGLDRINDISWNTYNDLNSLKNRYETAYESYRYNLIKGFYSNGTYNNWQKVNFKRLLIEKIKERISKDKRGDYIKIDDLVEILKTNIKNKKTLKNLESLKTQKKYFEKNYYEILKILENLNNKLKKIIEINMPDKENIVKELNNSILIYTNKRAAAKEDIDKIDASIKKFNDEITFEWKDLFNEYNLHELKKLGLKLSENTQLFKEITTFRKRKLRKIEEMNKKSGSASLAYNTEIRDLLLNLIITKYEIEKNVGEKIEENMISEIIKKIETEKTLINIQDLKMPWITYENSRIGMYISYPDSSMEEIEILHQSYTNFIEKFKQYLTEKQLEEQNINKEIKILENEIQKINDVEKNIKNELISTFSERVKKGLIEYDKYFFLKNIYKEYENEHKEYQETLTELIKEMKDSIKEIKNYINENKIVLKIKPLTYVISV